jgi:hypothetical protein
VQACGALRNGVVQLPNQDLTPVQLTVQYSKQPSVHFNVSDSGDEDPLVPLDDTPVVGAPVAPPAVPGVPPAPQHSLTPPARSLTPETPTPSVKRKESSPHPYFGLRSPTPVRRTPMPSPFTTAGNSPFVSAETSPTASPEPVCVEARLLPCTVRAF